MVSAIIVAAGSSYVMRAPENTVFVVVEERLLTQAEIADIQKYADRYVGYRLDYM